MKKLITCIIVIPILLFSACSEEKRLTRKAANAIDQSDYAKAVSYYDQILAKDSTSFRGNAGKGIVLSEHMGKYNEAIPYLERALKKSPEEVTPKLDGDLGKSYHQIGNYPRALYYYGKTTATNDEDSPYYDPMLSKRIADCKFALDNARVASAEEQNVSNIGTAINTEMPEYGPVYTRGNLIFTSKRKDTPKEKKNGVDGKYFESMYISKEENGKFGAPRRYTIPDLGDQSDFGRVNESAVSVSGDKLYLFKGGELYEANLADVTKEPVKLSSSVNSNKPSDFQTFAAVAPDGSSIFFVRESERNGGGTDIYQAFKNSDGSWGKALMLPLSINTDYYEDAPYVADDGTLYFASNGLPGYGGFDIYKTKYVNGEWTAPENLGQPINTPGDEIYFVLGSNSPDGFYASSRQGGYGDMDIYHVHYVSTEMPECTGNDPEFTISAAPNGGILMYSFRANVPEQYKHNVRSVEWKVNGLVIDGDGDRAEYTFTEPGMYKVSAKAVVYCETCPKLQAICTEREVNAGDTSVVMNEIYEGDAPVKGIPAVDYSITWDMKPAYFDYDEYALRNDAISSLDNNIKILKANKELTLTINGYADARGTNEYNKALSAKRAGAVRAYLVRNGISASRIAGIMAYGEDMIENGCVDFVECSEEKHQENRKVEIKVSGSRILYTKVTLND